MNQQVRDLVVPLRRLYQTDERDLFEIERLHRRRGRRQLTFPTVNKNQLRQRFLLGEHALVATKDCFIHRREIVRTVYGSDYESTVLGTRWFAVLENNDAGNILCAGDIRDVE